MLHSQLIPATDGRSRKLMLVLHGLGDSLEGYRFLPDVLQLPNLNYLLVNAPDHYFGGYSWYDYGGNEQTGINRSRALLFELLDHQWEEGFAAEDTLMFGFSQGCLMTLEVGCRYPHRLAGCVGVSGYAHDPDQLLASLSPAAREQKFLITHGTEDPIVPFERTRRQVERFKQAGLDISWHAFAKAHTIIPEEIPLFRAFISARIE